MLNFPIPTSAPSPAPTTPQQYASPVPTAAPTILYAQEDVPFPSYNIIKDGVSTELYIMLDSNDNIYFAGSYGTMLQTVDYTVMMNNTVNGAYTLWSDEHYYSTSVSINFYTDFWSFFTNLCHLLKVQVAYSYAVCSGKLSNNFTVEYAISTSFSQVFLQ